MPAWNDDLQAASHQASGSAQAVRQLSAEFQSAQRSAFDLARKAKTEAERKEADRTMPDRRKYAQRFLLLASETIDEANAVDAPLWVVRNGNRTPEGDITRFEKSPIITSAATGSPQSAIQRLEESILTDRVAPR